MLRKMNWPSVECVEVRQLQLPMCMYVCVTVRVCEWREPWPKAQLNLSAGHKMR